MKKIFFLLPFIILCTFSCKEDKEDDNKIPVNNHEQQDDCHSDETSTEDDICSEASETFGDSNGYDCVDLGLPSGILWATMNVDATSVEESGIIDLNGQKLNLGSTRNKQLKAGNLWTRIENSTIRIDTDPIHKAMGGSWRLPNNCNFEELLEYCQKEWCTINGKNGWKFTGKNGNWIFLPTTGCFEHKHQEVEYLFKDTVPKWAVESEYHWNDTETWYTYEDRDILIKENEIAIYRTGSFEDISHFTGVGEISYYDLIFDEKELNFYSYGWIFDHWNSQHPMIPDSVQIRHVGYLRGVCPTK